MSTVLFEKISPEKATTNACKDEQVYCKSYTISDVVKDLIRFYEMAPGISMTQFLGYHSSIPKTTFLRHYTDSLLRDMKKRNEPVARARITAGVYLANLLKKKSKRTVKASWTNRYLTHDEELAFVQLMRILGNMGHGVTHEEALGIIDEYVHQDIDERERIECSEKVLRSILNRNKDIKLASAGSIDPARAKKANEDTRDAVFTKMDCYVKNLYAMGLTPDWKSYKDIPNTCIYNMDEVGTDTTKHRSKVICDAAETIRKYCQTPEGDGKMNMHITACLTTRADGTYTADG
jgi:3-keto-L-gulonate-6-phosphate decarboxylase